MPELPEVETVRQGLLPVMAGQVIDHALVRRADLRRPFPADLAQRVQGARVLGLRRRSKYLLIDLSTSDTMMIHLGMSGRLLISLGDHAPLGKHDHLVLYLAGGGRVVLNDPRRFGAVDLDPTDRIDAHPALALLGPEPLGNEFHAHYLAGRLAGRHSNIKNTLLDQKIVAGLGNIYVSEALFRAYIHPARLAGDVTIAEIGALFRHIQDVLREAIAAGGSSLRDYRKADGELGYFQHQFQVYDRAGQPCVRENCHGLIKRIAQSGRSSYFCPVCQGAGG